MADEHNNDESKKTLVAFVVGLLIGGMLVWAFGGPSDQKNEDAKADEQTASTTESSADADMEEVTASAIEVGDAKIGIEDQNAGDTVTISSATYPVEEGWIAVRDYQDDKEGYVLGAVRFSKRDGLNPMEIVLQRPTVAGQKYAISLYKEDGDTDWGNDERIEGVFGTFTAK